MRAIEAIIAVAPPLCIGRDALLGALAILVQCAVAADPR